MSYTQKPFLKTKLLKLSIFQLIPHPSFLPSDSLCNNYFTKILRLESHQYYSIIYKAQLSHFLLKSFFFFLLLNYGFTCLYYRGWKREERRRGHKGGNELLEFTFT